MCIYGTGGLAGSHVKEPAREAAGATAKSPKSPIVDIKSFVAAVRQHHDQYCDYPCFSTDDILNLLLCQILDIPAIKENEGTLILSAWGSVFGNLSWAHLCDSFSAAVLQEVE